MSVSFKKQYFKQFTSKEVFDQLVDYHTIVEMLDNCRTKYTNDQAVIKSDGSIATFDQLYCDAAKFSSYLINRNLCKANIAIISLGNYDFEVASLGIMGSGNVAVLIPADFGKDLICEYLQKFDVKLVFVDEVNKNKLKGLSIETIDITQPCLNETQGFKDDIKPHDAACILLTGGTTGKHKGVVLSHDALMAGTINGCYGLKNVFKQMYFCLIPLTHSFGFIRNMLCAIYTGSLIYYNMNKTKLFQELAVYKPTVLIIVPALAELFLSLIKSQTLGIVGGKLHTIICGSANVPPYLALEYDKLNITFCPGYGLTECANIVSGNPIANKCPDSVGLIFPDQEAKIVNGELYLKGRTLFSGYYNDKEQTDLAFDHGWFKTGDLAKFDENNNLYIVGRIKDLIVLPSGEKVSPAYIEAKVDKLDFVQDSLVYQQANEYGINELVCEVFLRKAIVDKLGLKGQDLFDYVWRHLQEINKDLLSYENIKKLVIREKDFERTPAMKIIRKKH